MAAQFNINIENLKSDDGSFSEPDVRVLEKATGMKWKDIHEKAQKQEGKKPDKPISEFTASDKIAYIEEHGRDAFQELVKSG